MVAPETLTTNNVIEVASWLLGRPLTEQEGISAPECVAAERRLGCPVPAALRDFYLAAGRQPVITSSFQRFAEPNEWTLSQGKIVFLEECQGVCYWATDSQSKVYQATDLKTPEWYEEPVDLPEFLRVLLYYQMAQGGYPFGGIIPSEKFSSTDCVQALIDDMGGQVAVDMDDLRIFVVADQVLVWYLHENGALFEPGLFLSALRKEPFQLLCDKWQFEDLS